MQIKFNGVMTQQKMLEMLALLLKQYETTGLDRVMNVCIELRPPPRDEKLESGSPCDDTSDLRNLKIELSPSDRGPQDPRWVPVPPGTIASGSSADDTLKFRELVERRWAEIDIGRDVGARTDDGDTVALVPRLLRAMLAAIPSWDGSIDGANGVAEFDRPRDELDGGSYWDATLNDDGFMRMSTLHLLNSNADNISHKRRAALRNFPMMWELPMPGVSRELRDKLLKELGEIVQSKVRAASIIALRPVRYGKPQLASGAVPQTGVDARSMTLLEVVFEADNAAEVVRDELEGYRRDWKPAAGKAPS